MAAIELKLGMTVNPENLPTLSEQQIQDGWHFEEIQTLEGKLTIIAGPKGWKHE